MRICVCGQFYHGGQDSSPLTVTVDLKKDIDRITIFDYLSNNSSHEKKHSIFLAIIFNMP